MGYCFASIYRNDGVGGVRHSGRIMDMLVVPWDVFVQTLTGKFTDWGSSE